MSFTRWKGSKQFSLVAVVVEDHDEALHHIYRRIGGKTLPFMDLTMLHLDSHPDLLLPKNLEAECIFNKETLFEKLSIGSWILPAVYAGHISRVIWLKPPWATQMKEQSSCFAVGKHMETGYLRVTSKETYYLGELLYAASDKLEKHKQLNLHVKTMNPDNPGEATKLVGSWICEQSELPAKVPETEGWKQGYVGKESREERAGNSAQGSPGPEHSYILDIDLDFFSTTNPLEVTCGLLQKLYYFEPPVNDSEEAVQECLQKRQEQLAELKDIFSKLQKGEPLEPESSEKHKLAQALVTVMQASDPRDQHIDYDWLHEMGSGCDDTELPHHLSTEAEILALVENVKTLLQNLPTPAFITIARSSTDDYCPLSQVDFIQERVLHMLRNVYPRLDIHMEYKEKDDGRTKAESNCAN